MKKIVLVLAIMISTTMTANAFIDNQYMTTEQYMVNTGYSKEMSRLMAVVNQDPYRPMHDNSDERNLRDLSRKVYNYLIPAMYTDYDFYYHNINNNTVDWRDY